METENRKFFKIVDPEGHRGVVYHEGLNVDPTQFNPSGDCDGGGLYFAGRDIFSFIDYGTDVYEVEPVGEVYQNPGTPEKFKAHALNMKYVGEWEDVNVMKFLVESGADVHADGDYAIRWASCFGHLDVVKFLVESGADVRAFGDSAIRRASRYGQLDVVKFLVESGADVRAGGDSAIRRASRYGQLDVVKFLVASGANVHVCDDYAIRWASDNGHDDVVEYIKSLK